MAKLGLNLSGVETEKPRSEFWIVPTGTYSVKVSKADIIDTKSGGAAIVFGYQIQDGEFEGKTIKDFVNVQNASAKAQEIGLQRLKTVAFATGYTNDMIDDTDSLIGLESFDVYVTEEQDGEYKRNNVKSVLVTRDLTPKKLESKPATMTKPWKK